jgi:putative ABC transport system ATP-binding protein
MAFIELRDVTKSYKKGDHLVTPLENVTLDIEQGEFFVLLGPSGSGKTTLLNLLAAIDRPERGTISVGGADLGKKPSRALADWRAEHVGYIFQQANLVPVLSAYENVELPLWLHKLTRAERHRRVLVALEAVGLLDRADHLPKQLSGGQEQRVAIARAMAMDPSVLLCDEPTGDLDRVSADQVLEILARLCTENGTTVVIVTHDPLASARAKRSLHLDKGVLVDAPEAAAP